MIVFFVIYKLNRFTANIQQIDDKYTHYKINMSIQTNYDLMSFLYKITINKG